MGLYRWNLMPPWLISCLWVEAGDGGKQRWPPVLFLLEGPFVTGFTFFQTIPSQGWNLSFCLISPSLIYGNLGRPLSEAPHASVSIWRKLNTNKKDHLTCFLQFQGEFHNSHFCWMIPEGNFLPTKAQIYRFIGALLRGQIIQINWAKVAFTEHQRFNSRQWKGFLMHADSCTQL